MFLELHMIQNFAPSNLNRDDTNAPKECTFGGSRRARISSQCFKRAIRTYVRDQQLLPADRVSERTKRVVKAITDRLVNAGHPVEQARAVVRAALQGFAGKVDSDDRTSYLWFLGRAELDALAAACQKHWSELAAVGGTSEDTPDVQPSGKSAKDAKKQEKKAVPETVRKALERCLDGGKAADLALFGRMLADMPDKNIDAACQVAHAISTHRVAPEFDFYTAVDDLNPDDTAGAGMMGTVEFNSACFYRYVNVDLRQLVQNLDGDLELARDTVSAFLRAAIGAIPTGKQNSTAAQNPPSLILAVLRRKGLWSLANAFVKPVFVSESGDLVEKSVEALLAYWDRVVSVYGGDGLDFGGAVTTIEQPINPNGVQGIPNVSTLIREVTARLEFTSPEG